MNGSTLQTKPKSVLSVRRSYSGYQQYPVNTTMQQPVAAVRGPPGILGFPYISLLDLIKTDGAADNAPLINAAAASLASSNGGRIILPPGQIGIASTLLISTPNISIEGFGADMKHSGGLTGASTFLKWVGSSGGTMVTMASPPGASNPKMTGGGLRGIAFNANGLAANGFQLISWNRARFTDLAFYEFLTNAVLLDVVASLADPRDAQHNTFEQIYICQIAQSGVGLQLQSSTPGGNPSFNQFRDVMVEHANGTGVVLANCDNNRFSDLVVHKNGGSGVGIDLQGGNAGPNYVCRNNVLEHPTYSSLVSRGTTSYTYPAFDNIIRDVDSQSGVSVPTIETGSRLTSWSRNDNMPIVTMAPAATTDLALSASERVTLAGGVSTITSFGTAPNRRRYVKFNSAYTITHNSTTLYCPGSVDLVTVPGDRAILESDLAGNWTFINYSRTVSAQPWTGTAVKKHSAMTLANGLNSDVTAPNTQYVRVTGPTGAFSIGGIAGGADATEVWIYNQTGQAMTLVNNDGGSLFVNRINTLTGADLTLRTGNSFCILIYDTGSQRWVVVSYN